jgi:hypothetical protein
MLSPGPASLLDQVVLQNDLVMSCMACCAKFLANEKCGSYVTSVPQICFVPSSAISFERAVLRMLQESFLP